MCQGWNVTGCTEISLFNYLCYLCLILQSVLGGSALEISLYTWNKHSFQFKDHRKTFSFQGHLNDTSLCCINPKKFTSPWIYFSFAYFPLTYLTLANLPLFSLNGTISVQTFIQKEFFLYLSHISWSYMEVMIISLFEIWSCHHLINTSYSLLSVSLKTLISIQISKSGSYLFFYIFFLPLT